MSDEKLDMILKMQIETIGRLQGLTIAVAHLWAIEARENPEGAASRALDDVDGTVDGVARQLPPGPEGIHADITHQLRRCLEVAAAQIQRAKREPPTSSNQN